MPGGVRGDGERAGVPRNVRNESAEFAVIRLSRD